MVLVACKSRSVCGDGKLETTVEGNHGHELSLPEDGLMRGAPARLRLSGGTHEHAVIVDTVDTEKLEHGEQVNTRASSVNAHTHDILLQCKN